MRKVRGILLLAVLLAGPACPTTAPGELPGLFPEPPPAGDGAVPSRPDGFVADPSTAIFHRLDCPRAAEIDPATRRFFVTPWEALNEGYAPCGYCEPLAGWR